MSEENTQNAISDEQWVQNQRGAVLGYCSRKELGITGFIDNKSALLPPFIGVWLVEAKKKKEKYWVVSGDLPIDHMLAKHAKNPREAIRHFALSWQLKAERLMTSLQEGRPQLGDPKKQTQFANFLVSRSEMLSQLVENDKIWTNHEA